MNIIKRTFIASILLLNVVIVFGQQRPSSAIEFVKISDNLYQINGGRGCNTGVYIGDDSVLLIDSKMDQASVDQVIEQLGKITDKPIKFIVNTHSDGDHINGNRFVPQPATVIAHENCRKDFFGTDRRGNPSQWNTPELLPFTPAVTFQDKMNIYLGSKQVQLWYFGVGHTMGDIVVYFPEEKTAFLGDQIFLTRPQLIHSYKGGNSFEHVKTLTKMLDTLDAEKFCSGHSEIASRQVIEKHITQMKHMQEQVKALIEHGKDVEQVKAQFQQDQGRLIESMFSEIKSKTM